MEPKNCKNYKNKDLRVVVQSLIDTLGWEKYHTPRNLVQSILLEASELLQKLQWRSEEEIEKLFEEVLSNKAILYEIADININLISLCERCSINLDEITIEKCNVIIERFRNRSGISHGSNRNDLRCTECRETVNVDWLFCPSCGSRLK